VQLHASPGIRKQLLAIIFSLSHQYLKIAYPNIAEHVKENITPTEFTALLDDKLPTHRLRNPSDIDPLHQIIYLQNRQDLHHMAHHAGPWLRNTQFASINETSFISERGNILFFPGDWGTGHIPPKLELLKKLIAAAGAKSNIAFISASLLTSDEHAAKRQLPWLAATPTKPHQFNLVCTHSSAGVEAKVTINTAFARPEDFSYAFYLYANGKKIDARAYKKSPHAQFYEIERQSDHTIVAYLRDQLGSVRSITRKISAAVPAWMPMVLTVLDSELAPMSAGFQAFF